MTFRSVEKDFVLLVCLPLIVGGMWACLAGIGSLRARTADALVKTQVDRNFKTTLKGYGLIAVGIVGVVSAFAIIDLLA